MEHQRLVPFLIGAGLLLGIIISWLAWRLRSRRMPWDQQKPRFIAVAVCSVAALISFGSAMYMMSS